MQRKFNLILVVCGMIILAPLAGCLNDSEGETQSSTPEVEIDIANNESDTNLTNNTQNTGNVSTPDTGNMGNNSNVTDNNNTTQERTYFVEYVNESLVEQDALILIAANGGEYIRLINKEGDLVHEWLTPNRLGNDFQLLPNGDILALFKPDYNLTSMTFGGFGGIVKIIGPNSEVKWSFDQFANDTAVAHHDVEMLPNGNVLVMVWEHLNCTIAGEMGIDCHDDNKDGLAYESLYEINITDNSVVWQWRSVDHTVQDLHPDKANYGNVTTQNHKIDFNFNTNHSKNGVSGDIMHANGIDYDEENNLIYLSVNFYNEIWVIDHSTNLSEAAGSTGGNYGVGGDLVYRFGNSLAYKSNESVIFNKIHYPNLIEDPSKSGYGNLLGFSNSGIASNISAVFEISLPVSNYPTMTPPEVIWSFSNESLYSRILSGAERGINNNTYISEGDYGVWEITDSGEIAWKLSYGPTWRAYVHYYGEPEIDNLILNRLVDG